MSQNIAKVVVDLALGKEFDYRIPAALVGHVRLGTRVIVPFGHTKKMGFVVALVGESPFPDLKEIKSLVGSKSLVEENILKLARWLADYYLAPIELALRAVLPAAVRKKGAAFRHQLYVAASADKAIKLAGTPLSERQAGILEQLDGLGGDLPLRDLLRAAGTTAETVRKLETLGLVKIYKKELRRDPLANTEYLPTPPLPLMPEQAAALDVVKRSIDTREPPVVLLYGVTGSGKTEVYLQAIDYVLQKGQGAIVLVPEIALTPQTVERFRSRFGEKIAVLHSHLSDGERHDEWHRLKASSAPIAIGARSALFAPIDNLGLIIVDEEHEPSYKQDEAPRYHARDVAVMRGYLEKCAVLLGTATPALESYRNALLGKYALVKLTHRVDHRRMPAVRVVDMRVEFEREGSMCVFSRDLIDAMRLRLDHAQQTILFLNRRGFASSLICRKCGYVARCDDCSVAFTYHRVENCLSCHICGERRPVPSVCPNPECRDPGIRYTGFGTQRVEEIVRKIFPQARVGRMDADTTICKDAYAKILGAFRAGKLDVLVGTQMIAKGLHFPNVTLVGILNADSALHLPDFRAGERTFQLLTQVAGRAGRGDVAGEVIVQTSTPFHPAIQAARRLDFEGFADQELAFREELSYPPFARLICLTIRGMDEERVASSSKEFATALEKVLPPTVILAGPVPAPLAKAKKYYRQQVILRTPQINLAVRPLRELLATFRWPAGVQCAADVDAMSLL